MDINHFIRVYVIIDPDQYEEERDPVMPPRTFKRVACIPLGSIAYLQEGVDRRTTIIVTKDADEFLADIDYNTIFNIWEQYYIDNSNRYISCFRSN